MTPTKTFLQLVCKCVEAEFRQSPKLNCFNLDSSMLSEMTKELLYSKNEIPAFALLSPFPMMHELAQPTYPSTLDSWN